MSTSDPTRRRPPLPIRFDPSGKQAERNEHPAGKHEHAAGRGLAVKLTGRAIGGSPGR